ncbi:MAG: hypothetical protein QNJ92_10900 [Alphaproteobacteria bacterium]|nr:hypothetical protein [Alphaproteobacteria bacterium]
MRKYLARRALKSFGGRYGYDVSFMEYMLDASPKAFFKFAPLGTLARHREAAPKQAFYAAKLVGALSEDCGPCTQLVADMAEEAGVAPKCIEAVLTRDLAAMCVDAALGFRFAEALVRPDPEIDDAREIIRGQWGDAGVIDLTFAVQIGRVFPMIKAGLGFTRSCQRVRIGDHQVDVVRPDVVKEAA